MKLMWNALKPHIKLNGRYIIRDVIGSGGFGITYRAYDIRNKKTVAVKEYFPAALCRRSGRHVIPTGEKNALVFNLGAEKFFEEADLLCRFNGNPNIVGVFDRFYKYNTVYFVMEYLDGITLEKYVGEYGTLSPENAIYIADKLTMALTILQSAGVLHRDISPDNIMLCRDGSVKLIDFGAAREILNGTHSYTVMMKTGFSPIEQYSQSTLADIRAEIYSLGATLFYALTGKQPEIPYLRMESDGEFCSALDVFPSELRGLVAKAAAVRPADRYQTIEEFRIAIAPLSSEAVKVPEELDAEKPLSKKSSRFIIPIIAAILAAVAAAFIFSNILDSQESSVILSLDSEYAGHFNIGGRISASRFKEIGGDVEITLHIRSWEDMDPHEICGVIPVNSDDRIMLKYLTAPDELWADDNGWISVDNDAETLTFVLSEEGVESLGDGELGFETFNVVIMSAELKHAEQKRNINIDDWYELRNAPYSVSENENGKIVTVPLSEDRIQSWPSFESQAIPKSAFYELEGDVKVTINIEAIKGLETEQRIVYVQNSGYCFRAMETKFLVPAIRDGMGNPLVKHDHHHGMMPEKSCSELIFIIPENAKEKMSAGVFFQCMGVKVTQARLENYNGEYDEFL